MVMGQRWTEVEEGWRGEDWKEKKEKRAGGVLEHFFRELQVAGGRGKMRSPEGNALDRRRRWRGGGCAEGPKTAGGPRGPDP